MTKQKPQRPHDAQEPIRVVVPVTRAERVALKHRALDQDCSVGMLVREALGLPATLASLTRNDAQTVG